MKTLIPFLLLTVSFLPGSAAILVDYQFSESGNGPSSIGTEVTVTSFVAGPGLIAVDPVIYTPGWAATPTSYVNGAGATPGTEALAVSSNDYHSFTITPTTGYAFNLQSLDFATAFYTASGGAVTLNGAFFVRSSVDNYSSTIGAVFPETHVTSASPEFHQRVVDLSGAAYQNLTAATTFRVYLYDNSNGATRYLAIDNVILNGETVAVPEPAAVAVVFTSAALMFRRRRS